MAFPNDPLPAQIFAQDFWQKYVADALRYIALNQGAAVSPGAVAGNTAAPAVIALPPYKTVVAEGVPLTTDGQEVVIPATALVCYITNLSDANGIFVRYGAGATTGNFNRYVAPKGELAIYDFKGTISVAGTDITGQASVV